MALVTLQDRSTRDMNAALECATSAEIVAWAVEEYEHRLCVTTSFADTVLVHLATQVAPDIEVVFLDTGFHFAETLATMRAAMERYKLRLTVVRPEHHNAQDALVNVWSDDAVSCCEARKVRPLANAMTEGGFSAWMSGLRRADSAGRATAPVVDVDQNGRVKVNPIVRWSDADVARYIAEHDLIVNPLLAQGYESIGCWPCTEPGQGRDGRWSNETKTECGLHLAGSDR